ncbi:uncharacterized protein BDZ83DRAFT_461116 [Colletotrichum acutatum]|uniref:Secreted protein n=1 Tax=Glomerella acutata TaxID=27357 RepID=A0AAD8UEJ7_GLOAC|nr:uncharacterized protein BDZ83DRAFT_461116 [Colletotrichum acutatum]KAK1719459.1 hypothetical protein BDZ83DRAFT_461116 [Colletotrichum acutatum]
MAPKKWPPLPLFIARCLLNVISGSSPTLLLSNLSVELGPWEAYVKWRARIFGPGSVRGDDPRRGPGPRRWRQSQEASLHRNLRAVVHNSLCCYSVTLSYTGNRRSRGGSSGRKSCRQATPMMSNQASCQGCSGFCYTPRHGIHGNWLFPNFLFKSLGCQEVDSGQTTGWSENACGVGGPGGLILAAPGFPHP